ncbi:rod shape-determining protein MreC [Candidatus Parcubacteria bacterium]|jgi:rod shape-determining protein MreC|nr:MAG: rod shape-determining protein MreC [Candidatus Parcubacteria bacterium]
MEKSRLRITILAVFLIVAALTFAGVLPIVQRIIKPILLPVSQLVNRVVTNVAQNFKSREDLQSLESENQALQQKIVELEIRQADLNRRLSELQLLRKEEDFLNRHELRGQPVRVIGRSQSSAQLLLLDAGLNQGLSLGQPVIAADGVLVGLIQEVGEITSSLKLLTSEGLNIAARVENETKSPGIVTGEKGVGIKLTLVPQNEVLQSSQSVVTSDLDPKVPSGLLIGSISKIEQTSGLLFQSATVIPALPYDTLNVLMVLTAQ